MYTRVESIHTLFNFFDQSFDSVTKRYIIYIDIQFMQFYVVTY